MRILLRFRLSAYSLPVVLSRTSTPHAQSLCQECDQHAVGDERHMLIECPALQGEQDKYATLFANGACTVQHFVWQVDITSGIAHMSGTALTI